MIDPAPRGLIRADAGQLPEWPGAVDDLDPVAGGIAKEAGGHRVVDHGGIHLESQTLRFEGRAGGGDVVDQDGDVANVALVGVTRPERVGR